MMRAFLDSERARIPLAIVGLLVLVSAVLFVGYLETGDDPDPDVDATLAFDRTESAIHAAVRQAMIAASEQAAQQPLTDVADNEWGRVLEDDAFTMSTGSNAEGVFESYLRTLLYLEVESNLDSVEQSVGNAETSVSIPPVDNASDLTAALDRVTIDPDPDGTTGTLTVEIDDVELVVTRDGQTVDETTRTVSVSVVTPILELHDHVEAYEQALNAEITESGLTQRLSTRLYGISYLRGWAQNYRAPVVEVLANRHVEPSTNSARYRIQQDVFGTADPELGGAVQAGWACMMLEDGETFLGNTDYSPDVGGQFLDGFDVDAETLCDVTDFVLDPGQGLPLDPQSLLSEVPGLDSEDEITIGQTAALPLAHMADPANEHSFESILDDLYTADIAVESESDVRTTPEFGECSGDSEKQIESIHTDPPTIDHDEQDGRFEFETTVTVTVSRLCADDSGENDGNQHEKTPGEQSGSDNNDDSERETSTLVFDLDSTFEVSTVGPGTRTAGKTTTDYEFEPGPNALEAPDRETVASGFPNYDTEVQEGLLSDALKQGIVSNLVTTRPGFEGFDECRDGSNDLETLYECWFETSLHDVSQAGKSSDSGGNSQGEVNADPHALVDGQLPATLGEDRTASVEPTTHLETDVLALTDRMFRDVQGIREVVSGVNHTFERQALLDPEEGNPFGGLIDELDRYETEYTDRTRFANVGERAVYEARLTYFDLLKNQFRWTELAHEESVGQLEDELDDVVDGLDEALEFLQRGADDPDPDESELESSELTDVTFEISGSPTYLESTNVTGADEPAVVANETFVPLAMRNEDHIDLPYETVIDGILDRVASALGLSDPDAELSFQMAADVLEAAERARQAPDVEERLDDPHTFDQLVAEFESSVDEGITAYESAAGAEITRTLYDERVVTCTLEAPDNVVEEFLTAPEERTYAILAGFEELDDPHTVDKWTTGNLRQAMSTFVGTSTRFDSRGWFSNDGDSVEEAMEQLATEIDEGEDLPFDPTVQAYDYSGCLDALDEGDEEYVETIERANAEIEKTVGDVLTEYNESHGIAATADAIGRGKLTSEAADAVQEALADEKYVPEHLPSTYRDREFEQWRELVASAVGPGLERGASLQVDIGSPEIAESIDEAIQKALDGVEEELIEERMDLDSDAETVREHATEELEELEEWVGNWEGTQNRAARVPAGVPLLPLPKYWYATVNAWDVNVSGEYARFEASADVATPVDTSGLTYTRQAQRVTHEIGGERRTLGHVDALSFDSRTVVVVVVPPGVGVGDRDEENPECTPTYPETGYLDDGTGTC